MRPEIPRESTRRDFRLPKNGNIHKGFRVWKTLFSCSASSIVLRFQSIGFFFHGFENFLNAKQSARGYKFCRIVFFHNAQDLYGGVNSRYPKKTLDIVDIGMILYKRSERKLPLLALYE